jgi:HEPN domain-containing protein
VDYYKLAEEERQVIKTLYDAGQYRHAITHSCMCIEYLLKTKMVQINPTSELLYGHDIINIFKEIEAKFKPEKDLTSGIRFCRKYLNESRYPESGTEIYTKDFAEQFMQHVENIKDYIVNECIITINDLVDRYKKL